MSKKPASTENPFGKMLEGRLTARQREVAPTFEPMLSATTPVAALPEARTADPIDIPAETIAPKPAGPPKPSLRVATHAEIRAQRKKIKTDNERNNIKRKRGRPANGKRSDPDWFGRTFYIRKQTDIKLEDAVRKLRRNGIEVDKSQLVDALLYAWAAVELGEVADFEIGAVLEKPSKD